MSKGKNYQHFCPVARTLEVIGEKWSLLIVRDLLRGPQRFTDLKMYLGGITPRWLSLRLQELERVGIVDRESKLGRREVWYELTAKGRDLEPVIVGLAVWGIDHAMRPPLRGESIYPEQTLAAIAAYLNATRHSLRDSRCWKFDFGDQVLAIVYDGERWVIGGASGKGDVLIQTSPEAWVEMLTAPPAEQERLFDALEPIGRRSAVSEMKRILVSPGN